MGKILCRRPGCFEPVTTPERMFCTEDCAKLARFRLATPPTYEPPQVIHIGNAKELLAGGNGSVEDAVPVPGLAKQPSG